MSHMAVRVDGLSKRYRLGALKNPYGRLSESMAGAVNRAVSKRAREAAKTDTNELWAIRDVSFEINQGEVVGIIGRNGAGKTTLLKMLARITEPTEGEARLHGKVGALLEVGAGLHHELSGRENIFLSGAILGMKSREIKSRFDEIVAFADIERFLDTPVKRYSSGMFLRLAFSVSAHLEPDILIVDEVLAVGDAAFQKKCLGKMGDVATSGRTVLFVSHNLGAVRSLCQRAILLDQGQVRYDGDPSTAITTYLTEEGPDAGGQIFWDDDEGPTSEDVSLRGVRLLTPSGVAQSVHEADKPIDVEILYEIKNAIRGARIVIEVTTPEGEIAFKTTDHDARPEVEQIGFHKSVCTIPGGLFNRRNYVISMSFDITNLRYLIRPIEIMDFTVAGPSNHGSNFPENWSGVLSPRCEWRLEPLASSELVSDPNSLASRQRG